MDVRPNHTVEERMNPIRTLAGIAATALLVAACGSGTTESTAPGGGATSTPAGATASPTGGDEGPEKLVIGFVPSREADALVETIQPVADYLTEALGIPVEGFVSTDYTGLVTAMETGQAHIGAFGPVALLNAVDRADAEIILQSERFGSGTYHTQFFTNDPDKYCSDAPVENERIVNDAPVTFLNCNGTARANNETPEGPVGLDSLSALEEGTAVSFVEQTSASGYIFPATIFATRGIDPTTDIQPIFPGSHDASVITVCNGQAEIGVSFDDARTAAETDCDVANEVVVFAYGPEIPNDGIAVAGVSDELRDRIKQALLDYAASEEGSAVLDSIYQITALTEPNLDSLQIVRDAVTELGLTD
jgi:phosphonate transport system substrate-binding protein